MARVALNHGVGGLEAGVGDLGHGEGLVVGLGRHDVRTRIREIQSRTFSAEMMGA